MNLLPCPFCGGQATVVQEIHIDRYTTEYAACKDCGLRTRDVSVYAAFRIWNSRASAAPMPPEVKEEKEPQPVIDAWIALRNRVSMRLNWLVRGQAMDMKEFAKDIRVLLARTKDKP